MRYNKKTYGYDHIVCMHSAATSTPPWASSALVQPRYFSTRATRIMMRRLEQRIRKQERAAGSMHGWRIAHLKANHRLDLLKSDMRGDQLKVTAHMYRDLFVIFAGALTVMSLVAGAINFKEALAELFAPQSEKMPAEESKEAPPPEKMHHPREALQVLGSWLL
uniref:Uncharacterized protein n=1 Tax=Oryza barthii TaxID=65489 RepID=A0A0D3GME9_9ORYZ